VGPEFSVTESVYCWSRADDEMTGGPEWEVSAEPCHWEMEGTEDEEEGDEKGGDDRTEEEEDDSEADEIRLTAGSQAPPSGLALLSMTGRSGTISARGCLQFVA
jgi:hypothetical protein